MRKILSIILTAAMTMSLFAAIPLGASAEAAGTALTFDTQAEIDYYNTDVGKNSTAAVQNSGTTQGNAFKYTVLDNDWGGEWESILRIAQPQTDGSVSSYKVKAGRTYSISFKYKNDTPVSSWGFYTKILFVGDYNNMGNLFYDCDGCVGAWTAKIQLPEVVTSPWTGTQAPTDGWQDYTASFYVPKNITFDEIALIFCIDDTNTDASFWVDDILVQEADDNGVSVMDFQSEAAKTFYADGNNNQKFEISQTWQTSDDLGMKFSSVAGYSSDTTTPVFRLSQSNANGTVTPITVKAGESYELSIDYKNDWGVNTWGNFYVKLMYIDGTQSVQGLTGNQVNIWKDWDEAYKVNLEGENTFPNTGDSGWQTYTFSFTVPDVADEKQLAIGMVNSEDVTGQGFLDNIILNRKADVVLHNDSLEGGSYTASVLEGTAIEDIQLPVAGSNITHLYTDAARTQLYTGTTVNESLELWADIENVTGDFDNYVLAKDYWDGTSFYIEQYSGTVNSNALTNKGQTVISNNEWPPIIKLIDGNGNKLTTVNGHIYTLDFDMAVEDVINIGDAGWVALGKTANLSSGVVDENFAYTGTDNNLTATYLKTLFTDAESKSYRHVKYEFKGTGGECNIISYLAGTTVYFDNIKIVDVTAQKALSDQNGNVLARGYDGETVKIPDAADADFVYYADENGIPVDTTVIRDNKTLTKVNSTIAVTDTDYDSVNRTVSFTTRFGGIGYTEANGGVTVNTITVGNTRYFVEDIGLLVAPTANVTGELTLDNLGDAIQISGTSLKYSANGTDELQVTAQIATSKYDRDYTVVGYVKCAGGKVIYSKTRSSIAKSYNAAAGIESVEDAAHTVTLSKTYTLVSNSEFNSAESLSNGWHAWGYVSNPHDSDANAADINYYSVDSATYTNNAGELVLDLKKTSDNTYDLPELLSNYLFTTGYVEVRAKYADIADLGGAIWLNSVSLSDEQLTIKPDATNVYMRPELDIVEFSKISEFYFTLHNWGTPEGGVFGERSQIRLANVWSHLESPHDLENYHTYGLERTEEAIRMYVDGTMYYELTYAYAIQQLKDGKWPFNDKTEAEVRALFVNPTYLILGTNGAQSINVGESAISTIDYVRFYQ